MNKINVLYKNSHFHSAALDRDISGNFEFSSDMTLSNLLRKASINNCEIYGERLKQKRGTTENGPSIFKSHPKLISDNSVLSLNAVNSFENKIVDEDTISSFLKCMNFQQHASCVPKKQKLHNPVPSYQKIVNVGNNLDRGKNILRNVGMSDNAKSCKKIALTQIDNAKENLLGAKLHSVLIKISAWLQEIRTAIKTAITPIEGMEDFARRQKRCVEFSSRFARNYLYQLGRQMTELRRFRSGGGMVPSRTPGAPSAARILSTACQTVLLAVQAYCNHVPTTVVAQPDKNSVHAKFIEMLRETCDLSRLMKKLSYTYTDIITMFSTVEDIESNCKSLVELIPEYLFLKPQVYNIGLQCTKVSMICRNKSRISTAADLPFHKRTTLESRLSMYSVNPKQPSGKDSAVWKRNSAALAKNKLNVQPRYKTAAAAIAAAAADRRAHQGPSVVKPFGAKHRGILTENRSANIPSGGLKISPVPSRIDEDNIITMVQADAARTKPRTSNWRDRLETKLQSLVDVIAAVKQEHDGSLGSGPDDDILENLNAVLEQVQRCGEGDDTKDSRKLQPHRVQNAIVVEPSPWTAKTRTTVTGAKNAKLYCVKDKSCFEPDPPVILNKPTIACTSIGPEKVSNLEPNHQNISKRKSNELTNTLKNTTTVKSQGRSITKLLNKSLICIVQYKLDYHEFSRRNFMFKKNRTVQPWIINEVSDGVLDVLLAAVLSEINVEGIVNKVYISEFQ